MTNRHATAQLKSLIESSFHVCVLSGAGISTESGIPDFRSPTGIWADASLMEAMSERYLRHHPSDFWEKYKFAFLNPEMLKAQPNAAHLSLAWMEEQGKHITIFTQNVDGLHQTAGSQHVYELHGNVQSAFCPACQTRYGLSEIFAEPVPHCRRYDIKGADCNEVLQPDTVLFGQEVRHFRQAALTMMACDLLLIVGSSLTVYPVAQLPDYAIKAGVRVAVLNLEPTVFDDRADIVIRERAGVILSQLV